MNKLLLRSLWLAAGLALVLGWQRDWFIGLIPSPRELPRFDGATGQPWINEGFVSREKLGFMRLGRLPPHLKTACSWVDGDGWQGRGESAWFKANRRFIHVAVAGYPHHQGCQLWAEFRDAADRITRIDCPLPDPTEQWGHWEIKTPAGAVAVRIVAEDHATDLFGWVGFSHPFRAWPESVPAGILLVQVFATLALVLVLVWGPGLLALQRFGVASGSVRAALILLGTGPLLLSLGGLIIWCLDGALSPQWLGLALVVAAWLAIGWSARRSGLVLTSSALETRVLTLAALVVAAITAKSFYSIGPRGELFHGTISRNFEMSDRIDSRYSFYVVQAATHHWGPTAPITDKFFYPWTFFSRGPLAGLAATTIVSATDGQPPDVMPDLRWSPYDQTGFAAYRITMIVLASSVIVVFCLVLVSFVGARWALIAAGLLALSPFGIHEILFTWPKWIATAWLVASFGLVHARRPFCAGLAIAIGYFYHPLVLLWGVWLALWAAGRAERNVRSVFMVWMRFGGGALLLVAPWVAMGALAPHSAETSIPGQGGFFVYWARADWAVATWETWWRTRWMNFANTFVPLHVYLHPPSFNHPKLGSAHEASGALVKFAQVWWNSLPFGLGLGLWVACLAGVARAFRIFPAAAWLLVAGPIAFIVAYWGMDPLGLMRECGHPLFVTLIGLTCLVASREPGWLQRVLQHRATPWLQLPETWVMLWLTTLVNTRRLPAEYHQMDTWYFILNALALAGAGWVVFRERQSDLPVERLAPAAQPMPA